MIPSITQALQCLGLTMQDIHHYQGEKDALTVVTNDARKFVVTAADVALLQPAPRPGPPPAIMPEPMQVAARTRKIHRPRPQG